MKAVKIIALVFLLVSLATCQRQAPPAPASELLAVSVPALPADPLDTAWNRAPEQVVPLLPQNLVPPHIEAPSVTQARVRVLYDGRQVAFLLRWSDKTRDDLALVSRFTDGVAVQLPADPDGELPEPTMGQPGRPVEITFWRASWQAEVNGRQRTLHTFFPNAWVDPHPPQSIPSGPARQEAERRYQVARSADNPLAVPAGERPVEDLTAQGFGTLTPLPRQFSNGRGIWRNEEWLVVIMRPLKMPGGGTYAALAVWDGARQNAGARKMRSAWLPLRLQERP